MPGPSLEGLPAVAERYPERVLAKLKEEEDEIRDRAVRGWVIDWGPQRGKDKEQPQSTYVPPERCVERLREREPVWALVREWCGAPNVEQFDEAVALRKAVSSLRGLVLDAAKVFEDRGDRYQARRLRKALDQVDGSS